MTTRQEPGEKFGDFKDLTEEFENLPEAKKQALAEAEPGEDFVEILDAEIEELSN